MKKSNIILYSIILSLVVNLIANIIFNYLPDTYPYTYLIVTIVLIVICILLVAFGNPSDGNNEEIANLAKSNTVQSINNTTPKLKVSRDEAYKELESQINKGCKIKELDITTEDDLKKARLKRDNWESYNNTLLLRIFSNETILDEYKHTNYHRSLNYIDARAIRWQIDFFKDTMDFKINKLKGIIDKLELMDG
jgi:hypothetical protein